MRTIETTIQLRHSKYVTLRTNSNYEVELTNKAQYTGKLRSFCLDGNSLDYIVIEPSRANRLLIFGRDIATISKSKEAK